MSTLLLEPEFLAALGFLYHLEVSLGALPQLWGQGAQPQTGNGQETREVNV